MTHNQENIDEIILSHVAFGLYSKSDIKEEIIATIEDEELEVPLDWVLQQIEFHWENKLQESQKWIKPTDVERLILAFDELCKQNITALHNAGYTTSDGIIAVTEIEQVLRNHNHKSDGFCFYNKQDLEQLLDNDNSSLWIAFNKLENTNDAIAVKIGEKVKKVLQKHGFTTQWNGKSTQRIEIKNMNWQRIYNENQPDLLDYTSVVNLILSQKK